MIGLLSLWRWATLQTFESWQEVDQEFEAPSRPGDTRKEGRPRFEGNLKKSKVSSGNSGLRSHGPRFRSASPRREKPEMPLYRCVWILVPRLNLNIDHETRPPRSGRPQAPPNIRAARLSVGSARRIERTRSRVHLRGLWRGRKCHRGSWRGLLRHHGRQGPGRCSHKSSKRKGRRRHKNLGGACRTISQLPPKRLRRRR